MPVRPTYPGVYVEELPSSVRPVAGVATSVTAFVGWSPRGPENVAVRVSSFGEYERRFGGLDPSSEMGLCVQQYFLNGGTDALVVRVARQGATKAAMTLNDADGTAALVLTARSAGDWANLLAVDVDAEGASGSAVSFNLTVTDLATGDTERFTDLSSDPTSTRFAPAVLNDADSGSAMVAAGPGDAAAKRPAVSGTEGKDLAGLPAAAATKAWKLTVQPDVPRAVPPPADPPPPPPGPPAQPTTPALTVTILEKSQPAPGSLAGWAALVERKVNEALAAADPQAYGGYRVRCGLNGSGKGLRLRGDSVREGAADAGFVVGSVTEDAANGDAAKLLGFDGVASRAGRYMPSGTVRGALRSATPGLAGDKPPGTSQIVGDAGAFTGLHALRRVDLFNLLCIPDATRAKPGSPFEQDPDVDADAVWAEAYSLCEQRRAMLLIDPPPSASDAEKALDWITGGLKTKGPNAVAHFPRVRVPDPTDGFRPRTVPPAAAIAGLYARTDASDGVWKAPAGTEARLRNLRGLATVMTDGENGVLNPLGLNCLRNFPLVGSVNWGARTTDGADALASQWKYVPVRRLALFIEESVVRGTQWAVFMGNDEPLWAQLRLNLTTFMHDLFRKGAFAGSAPRDAYLVKCDAETTTPADQDRGVVNVVVGFAPLKPAEFVIIRVKQLAAQAAL